MRSEQEEGRREGNQQLGHGTKMRKRARECQEEETDLFVVGLFLPSFVDPLAIPHKDSLRYWRGIEEAVTVKGVSVEVGESDLHPPTHPPTHPHTHTHTHTHRV